MTDDKTMVDEKSVDLNKVSKEVLDSIKVGTKEEAYWTNMLKKLKLSVENYEHEIVISKQIIKLCELKIRIEEERRSRGSKE